MKKRIWIFWLPAAVLSVVFCMAGCGKRSRGVWSMETGEILWEEANDVASGAGTLKAAGREETKESAAGESLVSDETKENREEETAAVYVCGAVNMPGVYALPAGSRICDAVEAAGGLTPEADGERVNLARRILDEERIYIPRRGEETEPALFSETEEAAKGENSEAGSGEKNAGRININTAGREELMQLPGIGEAKAEAILSYREENGSFLRPEDLMQVPGIKEASFRRLEEKICVE